MKINFFIILICFFSLAVNHKCYSGGAFRKPENTDNNNKKSPPRSSYPNGNVYRQSKPEEGPSTQVNVTYTFTIKGDTNPEKVNQMLSGNPFLNLLQKNQAPTNSDTIVSIFHRPQLTTEEMEKKQQELTKKEKELKEREQTLEKKIEELENSRQQSIEEKPQLKEQQKKNDETQTTSNHLKEEEKSVPQVSLPTITDEQEKQKGIVSFKFPALEIYRNQTSPNTHQELIVLGLCKIYIYPLRSHVKDPLFLKLEKRTPIKTAKELEKGKSVINKILNKRSNNVTLIDTINKGINDNLKYIFDEKDTDKIKEDYVVRFAIDDINNKLMMSIAIPGGQILFMKIPGD